MFRPLVPCPDCRRHVRAGEERCPFCAAILPEDLAARAVPGTRQRLSRAAAFVFGATVAVSACGSEVTSPKGASGSDEGATSGGGGDSGTGGAGTGAMGDQGGSAALYGLAPPDGGTTDDGGNVPPYGEPPPIDGGPDAQVQDGGGGEPLYGAPPPRD